MSAKEFVEASWADSTPEERKNVRQLAGNIRQQYMASNPDADTPSVESFRRYCYAAPKPEPEGMEFLSDLIYHNKHDDVYVISLPHHSKNAVFSGEKYRQMRKDYSNWDGAPSTINEIIRAHGLNRKDFIFIKKEAGWTHDSSPFTKEELADPERSVDSFVKDLAILKERQVEKAFQKVQWKETTQKAQEYDRLVAGTLKPLGEHIALNPPRRAPIKLKVEQLDYLALFSPADLHIGKLGVNGYNVQTARADVLASTDTLVERLAAKGLPEKVVLVLGNDWWHVDNPQGTTTAGTPQDVDGLPESTIPAGYETAVEIIDRLRYLGDVEIFIVPSNHSNWGDHHLGAALGLAYRGEDDVRVKGDVTPRQYLRFGVNLIGLEHGDGAKAKELGAIMSRECPEAWSMTRYRYWITGHLHHLKEVNEGGVHIMQAPSLGGDDRWHSKKGYVQAERGQVCYLFDRDEGHTTRELALMRGLHVEAVLDL